MVSSFYPTAKLRAFLHSVRTKNTGVITIFSENEIGRIGASARQHQKTEIIAFSTAFLVKPR
ncbi:hypothetical protein HMPREF9441_03723 [Paraprevotella clara YIT 11840]|uniref:Uncharacterized protein n=1 Tax=Paraprevotella clara YIT 11840 TaxID=762968 RepID=G5SWF0_9BACT|nr:hypothetical protein HMPREF9441_03723 [Paraprevotella clara YIT 11840]